MARRSSFPGNHEIIEIQNDDLHPPEHFRGSNHHMKSDLRTEEGDRRSLTSNRGRISSLEDDLTQLFDIFNRRASSQSAGSLRQNGTGSSKKSASKRRNGASATSSPNGFGIAERVNLKQALRGLSISQASEMAALKRSSKQAGSSEAGRITTMYRNVVAEEKTSTPQGETNKGLLEISLVPDNSDKSLHATPRSSMVVPDPPASNHNTSLERGVAPVSVNQREWVPESSKARGDTPKMKLPSKEKSSPLSSPSWIPDNHSDQKSGRSSLVQNIKTSTSSDARSRSSLVEMSARERLPSATATSTPTVGDYMQKGARSSLREGALFSTPDGFPEQTSLSNLSTKEKSTSIPSGSHSIAVSNALEVGNSMTSRTELFQASRPSSEPGFKTLKLDALQKEELQLPLSPSTPYHTDLSGNRSWENSKRIPGSKEQPTKFEDRGSPVNGGQMGYPVAASSNKGNSETDGKATKRVLRLVKPVMRTKNFVKRKTKKGAKTPSHGSVDITHSEFNNALYPGPSHIVCPRCQCVLNEAWEEVEPKDGDSLSSLPVSPTTDLSPSTAFASPSAEVSPLSHSGSLKADTSSEYVFSDSGTPSHRMDDVRKTQEVDGPTRGGKNPKSRDKSEFTQSSKSSPDECSTSTSNSEESNLSRPSCCDRPHMSKDVRWLAIRQVRMEHGTVGLRHFNLLKKLGCGDIGTVYLAELLGTNCLFAIKVMDNDFLARRKKITRAQTERQILRMLDHPFLPTLYCQFTSDNLSCLAMEYCPGGDLHVLRQRQSGRCFSEQAARFYVAEVLLALEYLHMLGVIYRDLKPENILVREDGHIMLSDFDLSLRCAVSPTLLVSPSTTETAKTGDTMSTSSGARCAEPFCIQQPSCFGPRHLHGSAATKPRKLKREPVDILRSLPLLVAEPTAARSNSFVGTHEYLAPEIIKGEGHGSAVDWWTFGIFLYELLYGRTPFKGAGNEETLANVVMQSLKFPDSPLVSLHARDLITGLLVKEPEGRLGTLRGAAEIKQHPFFEGLNWALIRCAVPPELPESRKFGVGHAKGSSQDKYTVNNKYLEYNDSTGEHLEFEVF